MKEARVRLLQLLQILPLDVLLVANAAALDALEQHVDRRLQVDHEIRRRRVDCEPRVYLFVENELLVIEREPREQTILVEQVVRNAHCVEQIVLANVFELARPLKQKEQLRLQRRRARIAIETLEKRIVVRLLQNQLAAEAPRKTSRQAGLADADRTFNDDKAVRRARLRISLPWISLRVLTYGCETVRSQRASPGRSTRP